jgi:hypothetical protein
MDLIVQSRDATTVSNQRAIVTPVIDFAILIYGVCRTARHDCNQGALFRNAFEMTPSHAGSHQQTR